MTTTYFRTIFFITIIIIHTSTICAQEGGNYTKPPSHIAKTVQGGQPYYAGMTREALYKIYPVDLQKSYYKDGNEEWILFIDEITKDDTKDAIVFYLKDGVVSGWKKKDVPLTPEERYKLVLERSKIAVTSRPSGGSAAAGNAKPRRPIYNPPQHYDDYR